MLPGIAATDAPCSALSVIYTKDGQFSRVEFFPKNPELVLMDTSIIVKSPVRTLVAGMGDALATYFEAQQAFISDSPNALHGKSTLTGQIIAKACYDILLTQGKQAKLSNEAGAVTKAFEAVVEANTLLSGLGFESGGLCAAHAVHNGFTVVEETHQMLHGEKVAFGVLVQLVM